MVLTEKESKEIRSLEFNDNQKNQLIRILKFYCYDDYITIDFLQKLRKWQSETHLQLSIKRLTITIEQVKLYYFLNNCTTNGDNSTNNKDTDIEIKGTTINKTDELSKGEVLKLKIKHSESIEYFNMNKLRKDIEKTMKTDFNTEEIKINYALIERLNKLLKWRKNWPKEENRNAYIGDLCDTLIDTLHSYTNIIEQRKNYCFCYDIFRIMLPALIEYYPIGYEGENFRAKSDFIRRCLTSYKNRINNGAKYWG